MTIRHADGEGGSEIIRREAYEWVARISSGEATAADAEEVKKWRSMSPQHEAAWRDAVLLWKTMGPALSQHGSQQPANLSRRFFLTGSALAASAAGAAYIGNFLGYVPGINTILADYTTSIGEQRTVKLTDGSVVELDGGSSLSFDFSAKGRRVSLESGAAVFHVARDEERPFTVAAQSGLTSALGTSFAISNGADQVAVDCLKGKILVECGASEQLTGGSSISYTASGLGKVTTDEPENMAAWRNGLLIFRDKPLVDVVLDINRHRKGRVIIGRTDLGEQRVSGVFHLERPNEILSHLEATMHVNAMHIPGGIVMIY